MSTIQAQCALVHVDSNLSAVATIQDPTVSLGFNSVVASATTTQSTIPLGAIVTPKRFLVSLLSGDDCLVGLDYGTDGVTFEQRLSGIQDFTFFRLNVEDKIETQTITTVADVSDSLDATFVTLDGNSGTWAIWIDTDNSGTAEPSHGKTSSVEITSIVTDATAAAVALAIYTDLIADADFLLDFSVAYDASVDDDFITITDKHTGTRVDLTDGAGGGATGFTLATTQAGAAFAPSIYIKSIGVSELVVAVSPN